MSQIIYFTVKQLYNLMNKDVILLEEKHLWSYEIKLGNTNNKRPSRHAYFISRGRFSDLLDDVVNEPLLVEVKS